MERRYESLVSGGCITLLGPKYVLLRPEFATARQKLRVRDGTVRRILIFIGGSDSTNQTRKALDAVKLIARPEISVDVVVGAGNPYRNEKQSLCNEMPSTQFHCQVSNMADLKKTTKKANKTKSKTTWERCLSGLPT